MRKTDREQTTIRLPAELKEKLQQETDRRGMGRVDKLVIFFHPFKKVFHLLDTF